jgi:L-iditol 2-dehydrogenase
LLKEYKKLEMTEMPEPQIGSDDLLVQVKACGICGSDIHGFDGSTGRRVPPWSWAMKLPVLSLKLATT